ncbi:EamA/RhaT family transporter [Pedobacter antarcticus]|uniref:EamA family transporter n=1 Tax=Pedobacter antarcticus TaxID=34086 RepID=UPI001C567098|nr:EamA/RhaT family transporter [Pedobacter antarcticus]
MIYILFSVCCSVIVSILLKLARRYKINVLQAVSFNYVAAAALGLFFFRPEPVQLLQAPPLLSFSLGIILPLLFLILASSVSKAGIVRTDIAQRLSLFIPIIAALYLFGESFNTLKIAGLAAGFTAIILILMKQSGKSKSQHFIFPILVFVGFGIVDVLFKQLASHLVIPYTTVLVSIFLISFLVSILIVLYRVFVKREKFQLINVLCGLILGAFNFGNILFYLKAHRVLSAEPSTVFAAMNMGVIVTGSIVGVLIFKEKLSKTNYFGIAMALLAILLITLSIHHAV